MLKTKTLFKIFIASCVLLILTVLSVNSPVGAVEIIVEAEPAVPTHMTVLKAVSREITREQALAIASRIFNVEKGEAKNKDGNWLIRQGSKVIWIYKFGFFKYYDESKLLIPNLPEEMPSTTDCKNIAEQFLEKLKAEGFVPQSLQISFSSVGNTTWTAYWLENGATTTFVCNIKVGFKLSYDGVPLWGPNAEVEVSIGKGGEITEFKGDFWNLEPAGMVQILTPRQAAEKLRKLGFQMSSGTIMPADKVKEAYVKSIELVYFAPSPEAPFETVSIMPYYLISGELIDKNRDIVVPFTRMVPAVAS